MYNVSKIDNNVNCTVQSFDNEEKLLKFLASGAGGSGLMWSPAIFNNSYKRDANYSHTPSLMVLDIDNGLSLANADARCRSLGLKFAILPTKSHQKMKNNVVCDRYRIILFLSKPIESREVFDCTWQYVKQELFPEMDPACSDEGRGYYFSTFIASYSLQGALLEPKATPMAPREQKSLKTVNSAQERDLRKSTYKFLADGAAPGTRDLEIFKAASDFKECGFDVEKAVSRILAAPIVYTSDMTERDVEDKVRSVFKRSRSANGHAEVRNSHTLNQFLSTATLVLDQQGEKQPLLISLTTGARITVASTVLPRYVGKEFYKQLEENAIRARYAYNPFQKTILSENPITGETSINNYEPPFWERSHFFQNGDLPIAQVEPPELIKRFLVHLVDGDLQSYEYLLDWMSQALTGRNLTILTAIGEEGVGKGTLAKLLSHLVGSSNFVKVRADVFKKSFNAPLENKRIVFIDEAALKGQEEYNRIKDVVNDEIELEKKGIDAYTVKNYASFFLASNDNNAIQPSPGDRRFSIVNMTKVKLKDSPLRGKVDEICSDGNIEAFVGFLLNREIKHDMMTPFKSKAKSEEIAAANLNEWEHYFVYEYLADNIGQEKTLFAVGEDIRQACNLRARPGRMRFEKLARHYPKFVELFKKGNTRHIRIKACPINENEAQYVVVEAKEPYLEWKQ